VRAKRQLVCYLGGSHSVKHSSESMSIILGIHPGSRITGDDSVICFPPSQAEQA
jgi:hypothetical protein